MRSFTISGRPSTCTYEGCKQTLRRMYQAHDPIAKSEALLRAGFEQGKRSVVEYVQDILPQLRRCRSSMPVQVDYLSKGLNDEGFRMGVSACQSTPDYELTPSQCQATQLSAVNYHSPGQPPATSNHLPFTRITTNYL